MTSTSSIKLSKCGTINNSNAAHPKISQQKTASPKKIKLNMPSDDSLDSEIEEEEDECVIVETDSQRSATKGKSIESEQISKNFYAEQNMNLAKEVTKYKELSQLKEFRIQELDDENFKLREYVVTIEEYAYLQKENYENLMESYQRIEKRNYELESMLSRENNNHSQTTLNEDVLDENEEGLFYIDNPANIGLIKLLDKKIAPFKKFANQLESALRKAAIQNVEEPSSTDSPNIANNRVMANNASLNRRPSSLPPAKNNRRSSLISSSEVSTASISEDELTLVTKPISPNTIKLFASNSIKPTIETSNSMANSSTLNKKVNKDDKDEIVESFNNIDVIENQNLNECVGSLAKDLLGLATVNEEPEDVEDDPKTANEKEVKQDRVLIALKNNQEKIESEEESDQEESDQEESDQEESDQDEKLDKNIEMEISENQEDFVDEAQEITPEINNIHSELQIPKISSISKEDTLKGMEKMKGSLEDFEFEKKNTKSSQISILPTMDTENVVNKKRKSSLLSRESLSKSDRRQSKAFIMTHEDTELINSLKQSDRQEFSKLATSIFPSEDGDDSTENDIENQKPKRSKKSHLNPIDIKKTPLNKKTIHKGSQTPIGDTACQSIEQTVEPLASLLIQVNTPNAIPKPNSIFKTKQQTPQKTEKVNKTLPKESMSKSKNQLEEVKNYMNEFFEEAAKSDPKSAMTSSSKKTPHQTNMPKDQLKDKPPPMPGSRPPRPPNQIETKKVILQKPGLTPKKADQESETTGKQQSDSIDSNKIAIQTPYKEKKSRSLLRSNRSSINDNSSVTVNKENNSLFVNERNSISNSSLNLIEQPLSENTRRSRTVINYKEIPLNAKMRCDKLNTVYIKQEKRVLNRSSSGSSDENLAPFTG